MKTYHQLISCHYASSIEFSLYHKHIKNNIFLSRLSRSMAAPVKLTTTNILNMIERTTRRRFYND